MVNIIDGVLRGLEKPIILWLLYHKPRHGYEIIVEFKKLTGRTLKPSIIYPFLHRLEEEGFASGQWVQRGRRRIKHYSLTAKGEELIKRIKEVFTKPIREFVLDIIEKGKTIH